MIALEKITIPKRYRWTYELSDNSGYAMHNWTLIGSRGAVNLHITDYGETRMDSLRERFSGGVEMHYRVPPKYMDSDPPSHDVCHILKAPCWHDGSSLMCSERFVPIIEGGASHQSILNALVHVADRAFTDEVAE